MLRKNVNGSIDVVTISPTVVILRRISEVDLL